MRLLLADDDPDSRALALRALRREFPGAEAIEPVDMASFHTALTGPEPDLFVTDYDLRWSDGFALFDALRQRWPGCPAIMFTGTGNEELAVRAIKAGFDDYLVKAPRQFKRLATAAQVAIERRAEHRALREDKDAVVQELYHRLHNNLQLVISLLAFTARTVAESGTRDKLDDLGHRIQSLSTLQEQFYRMGDFRRVDFARFLDERVRDLVALAGGRVAPRTALQPVEVSLAAAVPLGLLANELILGAVKHGFPDEARGELRVELHRDGDAVMLRVADDGAGRIAAAADADGLGVQLVRRLALQLDAEIACVPEGAGTEWRVRLKA